MTSPCLDVETWSPLRVFLFGLFNRTPKSNAAAVDELALGPGDRFLDLGCGLGAALERAVATGAEVAGIDPSPAMVERAAKRVPGAEVKLGSAESIPFGDDRFTAALAVATYHHWADSDAGLAEIHRVLAGGGRLLIVEARMKKGAGHGLDPGAGDRLVEDLERHGFTESAMRSMRVGRHDYLAISALKSSSATV